MYDDQEQVAPETGDVVAPETEQVAPATGDVVAPEETKQEEAPVVEPEEKEAPTPEPEDVAKPEDTNGNEEVPNPDPDMPEDTGEEE